MMSGYRDFLYGTFHYLEQTHWPNGIFICAYARDLEI